ncbi:MAG: DUF4956 domain-containing protein [Planctomycetota bacterium]
MPTWLEPVFDKSSALSWPTLSIRLAVSLVLGLAVVGIYRATRRSVSVTSTFPATLVLLSILIAMVTQVIGDNLALAFSLVGALSVVRFRTSVRDTKDTAFVIVAVVVGMATGLGQTMVALCGLVAVGIAAFLFRDRIAVSAVASREMILVVRLVWTAELEAQVVGLLGHFAQDVEALSASTIRHGAGMELTYQLRLLPTTTLTHLVSELTRFEGVQSVDLRKDREDS